MKRPVCILISLLAALLLAVPFSVYADDGKAAQDLTDLCVPESDTHPDLKAQIIDTDMRYCASFGAHMSFSLSWTDDVAADRLCLQWRVLPEGVRVTQYDGDGGELGSAILPALPETVTQLLPDARSVEITAGEQGMRVAFCRVYGEGVLPDPFHEWQDTPERLDYLLISTHPDDDVLYLGSIVPTYGAERGYVGTIAYVTCGTRQRMTEAENGAWAMGLRYHPLFLGFPDVPRNASQQQKNTFVYDQLLLCTVRLYRAYRPLVVFAQDRKGEYGHWQHKLTSKAALEAATLAADPEYDPESVESDGAWQVQKVYLHLYKKNPILIDAHAPLSFFGGDDAFTVARRAYKKHQSQQRYRFAVRRDNGKYAFNRFGMAFGAVEPGEDVFDNIDETLFSGYVSPTPEPTAEPTPSPTPEPTVEPTPSPTPTAEPTAAPSVTPEPQQAQKSAENPYTWVLLGILFAAGIACAWLFDAKKRSDRSERTGD